VPTGQGGDAANGVRLTPTSTKKILDENPELQRHWTSLIPQGKMGRPEDLMGAVTFLCSEASNYVTGEDLLIGGGLHASAPIKP
jgi:NAD(P)-dependent dehydrogenase (short-subunit alcohol dehydrogenase family)